MQFASLKQGLQPLEPFSIKDGSVWTTDADKCPYKHVTAPISSDLSVGVGIFST